MHFNPNIQGIIVSPQIIKITIRFIVFFNINFLKDSEILKQPYGSKLVKAFFSVRIMNVIGVIPKAFFFAL